MLLGEPGSGKTTAFTEEATAMGGGASYVTVKSFLLSGAPAGWDKSKVLFIDALDEHRASSNSVGASLEAVHKKLIELGRPCFRLSCREADWAATGVEDLRAASPTETVDALWLDSLTERDVRKMIDHWTPSLVEDAEGFLEEVRQRRLTALLGNPLLLRLLVEAVHRDSWPDSRKATYELACQSMAQEHNKVHRSVERIGQPLTQVLHAAGLIDALLLLSDRQAFTLDPSEAGPDVMYWQDGDAILSQLNQAVQVAALSKLFAVEGERYSPRHRTIAEFLAAKAVARLIEEDGLPLSRVLTLMTGHDGRVVDSLRGLYAWMAIYCRTHRSILIELDPVALVLYGDVSEFSSSEKVLLLERLRIDGEHVRWTKNSEWETHAFGALGTPDMRDTFAEVLESPLRDSSHQFLLLCILDAIRYGQAMPELRVSIEGVVHDGTYRDHIRVSALNLLLEKSLLGVAEAKLILGRIRRGTVIDDEDELCGTLLGHLYPEHLTVDEVLLDLRPRKNSSLLGAMYVFWMLEFCRRTELESLPRVADLIVERRTFNTNIDEDIPPDEHAYETQSFLAEVLARAVLSAGAKVSVEQLHRWLGIALDRHGFQHLEAGKEAIVRRWLSRRPEKMKELYLYGINHLDVDPRFGARSFWTVKERLLRAKIPQDWYVWLLSVAAATEEQDIARYCFEEATRTAMHLSAGFDITLDEIERWVHENSQKWPAAESWKREITSCSLDDPQARHHANVKERNAKYAVQTMERQRGIAPQLPRLFDGIGPPSLHSDVVLAYQKRFSNIEGETPLERVKSYLVVDDEDARLAIEGFKLVLFRADMPKPQEVLELYDQKRKEFYLAGPALLGAQLAFEENSRVWESWSDELRQTLVGFQYISGAETPQWYTELLKKNPGLLAGMLVPICISQLKQLPEPHWYKWLSSKSGLMSRQLAELVLPAILRALPSEPSDAQIRAVDHVLIPAILEFLPKEYAHELVKEKLLQLGTSDKLAVSLHVGACRLEPAKHCAALVDLIDRDPTLVSAMERALAHEDFETFQALAQQPTCAGRFIEALASIPEPSGSERLEDGSSTRWFRDSSYKLARALVKNPSVETSHVFARLNRVLAGTHIESTLFALTYEQAELARNAGYVPAASTAVAKLLANGEPVSAKDMGELIRDQLAVAAKKIRYDDTNGLADFYDRGADGMSVLKPENRCRDLLLRYIRDKMEARGVAVDKEVHHGGERRADMQGGKVLKSGRIIVPVEVKKSSHPQVWTAWRDQLEKRYMGNPASEGIGLYVVLWSGQGAKRAPDGGKPRSAQEMAEIFSALIPAEKRGHILGLVVDLSQEES
ncbi:hypothetical protein [Aquabacterium sp.]|uniref:hypothetical protein n=1 Tax=Aquabacterium sp. TaxID=1872578 RepID=UPI003BB01835